MKKLLKVLTFIFICVSSVNVLARDAFVLMDFEDADLKLVIKFVSEITNENFVVDEHIKGKVSIIAPSEVPITELRNVLESILRVSGYVMIPSGAVTKIVPIEEAGREIKEDVKGAYLTQVIPLKETDAEKISSLIKPFLSKGGHVTYYAPTNTVVISDIADHVARIKKVVDALDQPNLHQRTQISVYPLEQADAQSLAEVLNKLFEKDRRLSDQKHQEPPHIVADTSTNSLIIRANNSQFDSIAQTIKTLDKRKKQVLIEVLIVEVTMDQAYKLGIEWATAEGAVFGTREGFNQDRIFSAEDIVTNILTGGGFAGYSAAYLHDTIQVGGVEIPRIGVLINAFKDRTDVDILSTPQILTTDHEEAEILVGENRAFIKNAQVTPEGGTVRTFEFKDVGLSLRITPHITKDNFVRMEVYQKVEDVIGQTFEGAVETTKREARTNVIVKDSQTIVIGGLIRERKSYGLKKVPFFGDIPFFGIPFRNTTEERIKTNLFIFISPHVMSSDEQLLRFTEKSQRVLKDDRVKRKRRSRFGRS